MRAILMCIDLNQEVSTASQVSDIRSMQEIICNTPPQVDKLECENRRIRAVGRRKQRACISLAWYRFLHISCVKKALAHFFSRLFYFARKDVPTYFYPLNTHQNHHDQRTVYYHLALATGDCPTYGDSQEKGGDRKSDKTKTDKSKSDKSKRENDKGLKKVKPPKRDGLASILQKSQI
jgi:hypothetical protein